MHPNIEALRRMDPCWREHFACAHNYTCPDVHHQTLKRLVNEAIVLETVLVLLEVGRTVPVEVFQHGAICWIPGKIVGVRLPPSMVVTPQSPGVEITVLCPPTNMCAMEYDFASHGRLWRFGEPPNRQVQETAAFLVWQSFCRKLVPLPVPLWAIVENFLVHSNRFPSVLASQVLWSHARMRSRKPSF